MKSYKVTAQSMSGAKIQERIQAQSEAEAIRLVSEKGLIVLSAEEVKSNTKNKQLKTKELIIFCQIMGAMMNAGTTVDKALDLARNRAQSENEVRTYIHLYEEVLKGTPIHEAMATSGSFPPLLINMISSGSVSGDLGEVFNVMAEYYNEEAKLNRKIKSAMIYPIVLGIIATIAVIILTVFVLPGIVESFDTGAPLPLITRILMGFSDFLITKWWLIILVIAGVIFGSREWLAVPENRLKFDKRKLSMPIVGPLLKTIYSSRAARTIASLYANGTPMLTIVKETGGTIGNKYVEELFREIEIKVNTGETLSKSLEDTGVFDPMLYSMIEVGEESGDLNDVLRSTSEFFNEEAEAATESLVGLLEPIFLVIMGIIIGGIVIAIIMPMMSMYDSIG